MLHNNQTNTHAVKSVRFSSPDERALQWGNRAGIGAARQQRTDVVLDRGLVVVCTLVIDGLGDRCAGEPGRGEGRVLAGLEHGAFSKVGRIHNNERTVISPARYEA